MEKLIVGNWKMHGDHDLCAEIGALAPWLAQKSHKQRGAKTRVVICPPFPLIPAAFAKAQEQIAIGAQNCHNQDFGAYSGEVSAMMLAQCGVRYILAGHSERRRDFHEQGAMIGQKIAAIQRAGLCAILCVGESLAQKNAGQTRQILADDIADCLPQNMRSANLAIAYEPLWAIGSGRTPDMAEISEITGFLSQIWRERFSDQPQGRILYGGSVTAKNAAALAAIGSLSGVLIGKASLEIDELKKIITAFQSW